MFSTSAKYSSVQFILTLLFTTALVMAMLLPDGSSTTVRYLIYFLLGINMLLGIAIAVSWISTSASLILTEAISSAFCSPFAVMMDVNIELLHLRPHQERNSDTPIYKQPPTWLKQLLLLSFLSNNSSVDCKGPCCFFLCWTFCKIIKCSFPSVDYNPREMKVTHCTDGKGMYICPLHEKVGILALFAGALAIGRWFLPLESLIASFFYCIITDKLFIKHVNKWDISFLCEDVEGLEPLLIQGVYLSIELLLSVLFVVAHIFYCHVIIVVFPVLLFNILIPFHYFIKEVFEPYKKEQNKRNVFMRASKTDLRRYNDLCAICLSPMVHGRVTPCNHIFHGHCLRRSLRGSGACPMCNQKLRNHEKLKLNLIAQNFVFS